MGAILPEQHVHRPYSRVPALSIQTYGRRVMSGPGSEEAAPNRARRLVPFLVWVILMTVAMSGHVRAQESGKRQLEDRFSLRAAVGAQFVQGGGRRGSRPKGSRAHRRSRRRPSHRANEKSPSRCSGRPSPHFR